MRGRAARRRVAEQYSEPRVPAARVLRRLRRVGHLERGEALPCGALREDGLQLGDVLAHDVELGAQLAVSAVAVHLRRAEVHRERAAARVARQPAAPREAAWLGLGVRG